MEQELRQGDEKVQCKAASACWKVAYSDPDCRNSLGLVLLPYTSHLTPHTSHLALQVVIAALVDSLKVGYVPLQERASGALASLSSR